MFANKTLPTQPIIGLCFGIKQKWGTIIESPTPAMRKPKHGFSNCPVKNDAVSNAAEGLYNYSMMSVKGLLFKIVSNFLIVIREFTVSS